MQNCFLSKFFPISKTIALRKEISNFQPMDEETFSESWERFKGLIRRCPHHGFENSRLAQHFYESQNDDNRHKPIWQLEDHFMLRMKMRCLIFLKM